ncbi:hypothetical protein GALL_19700 [mine drainage metagenome]|uniref:YhdP central domain-containing protein n=1 Tax=mine drainage metagenome TaxID=410659 RepID=A0A1J5TVD7_9ZZZZ
MVKKSLLKLYRVTLLLTGALIFVMLASAAVIQFWLFPNIDTYKEKIANFASQASKQKVVIGDIKADWQGINPHLSLSYIDIFDTENRPALQLKNIDVSLSWLSIPMLEPHLSELNIHTPELTIRRVANGEIFVGGISLRSESKPALPNWLLRQTKLTVLNAKIVWLDEMRGAPSLSLNNLNLEILSPPWRSLMKNHQFILSARPSIGSVNPISFTGSIYGNDISQLNQWHGSVTMQLKNADLVAFKPWVDYPINLLSGIGSTEITVGFANRLVKSMESNISLDNVQLKLNADTDNIVLNKLAGRLSWENANTGQSFKVNNFTLNTNTGLNLQNVEGSYTHNSLGDKTISLNLAHISLAATKPYWTQLALPTDILQKLTSLSPTGTLNNLSLKWQGNGSVTKSYQLDSRFNDLGIDAFEKIPGFNNLTGEIKADQSSGKLKLYTQNTTLDFKNILRWPIPGNKLDGDIHWSIRDKKTTIQISQLDISNPHLSGNISASYLIDSNKSGYLDLKGTVYKGDAKFAKFYFPTMLNEATLHWLDTSILAGHTEDANIIIKGRLADFPFVDSKNNLDSKLGLFRVTAKISDSLLEFGTGWPAIEDLGLNLLFEGKRMELNAYTGHLLGNQITKSKTTIAQLDADNPILNVDSELRGPVDEGIKFVNQSPVTEAALGFTEDLKTSGLGKLNLSLKIPLQKIEASQYKGLYQITNGSMANENIPTLSQINGQLEFTESSLIAKNIKAIAFGAPLTFSLNSGKDKVVHIAAKGKLNDDAIKQALGSAASYISGSTDWTGDISIQKPRVNISIRSDLVGISSTLPAPLNKTAYEHINLRVNKRQEANIDAINLNFGNKLRAKIVRTANNGVLQLDGAAISLNTNDQNPTTDFNTSNDDVSQAKGLQLTGNLDYLDADAWRNVIDSFQINNRQDNLQANLLAINKLDLKISKLDIFDKRINQLKITNKSGKEGLQANVQSREITGDLQWLSQNNGKLIAHLSNLIIPDATPGRAKAIANVNKVNQNYPALDLTTDRFEFNKKDFGGLELVAYPRRDDWIIQKLKLISPESTISTEGQWNNWLKNPSTYLNVAWDIKDLGQTLKRFGYPDTIKGGAGELSGQLSWPSSPQDFDTTRLNGNLQFEVRKGQILKVQPGVGRLLGLLSLQSLPRRLTLDFRDLFSNGFAFDKINANVKIDHGVMRSDNFLMTGPAANVTIKGETNLQQETQHLFVRVMPNVSDSVSLAALAGGPLVGAVAFLAQKILKDPLNKIVSTEYEIIGTWDKPQELKAAISNQEDN